jgi:nucleoside 2-deoxyribosyltransferase
MTITVCGSMKFWAEMLQVQNVLKDAGHTVLVPKGIGQEVPVEARTDLTEEEIISAKIEYDFIRDHFRNIDASDAILVLNYRKNGIENYIGGNTFLEMGYAFGRNKRIYLINPVPEMDYRTEMHAMQPVIVGPDLNHLR